MSNGVKSFEDLRVFQDARALTGHIWRITRNKPFYSDKVLIGQLRRAGLSIVSNIAEGFERGHARSSDGFSRLRKDPVAKYERKFWLRRT